MVLVVLFSLLTFPSCIGMEKNDPITEPEWKKEFLALGEQILRDSNIITNDPAEHETELIRQTLAHLIRKTSAYQDFPSLLSRAVQGHPEWVALTDCVTYNPLVSLITNQYYSDTFNPQALIRWQPYINHRSSIVPHHSCLSAAIMNFENICRDSRARLLPFIDFLMENGADPNLPAKNNGNCPLHLAVMYNPSPEVITKLLSFPTVNVNAINYKNETPLDIAVNKEGDLSSPSTEQMLSIIQLLKNAGALTYQQVMNNRPLRKRCIAFVNDNIETMQSHLKRITLPAELEQELTLPASKPNPEHKSQDS